MAQTSGAPTMVLRLTVPTAGEFSSVAADLAVKIAEHLGQTEASAKATGQAIHELVADVAPGGADQDVTFEFHRVDDTLRIAAECGGRSAEARHPLPTS
jgi:hypothetical protein